MLFISLKTFFGGKGVRLGRDGHFSHKTLLGGSIFPYNLKKCITSFCREHTPINPNWLCWVRRMDIFHRIWISALFPIWIAGVFWLGRRGGKISGHSSYSGVMSTLVHFPAFPGLVVHRIGIHESLAHQLWNLANVFELHHDRLRSKRELHLPPANVPMRTNSRNNKWINR